LAWGRDFFLCHHPPASTDYMHDDDDDDERRGWLLAIPNQPFGVDESKVCSTSYDGFMTDGKRREDSTCGKMN